MPRWQGLAASPFLCSSSTAIAASACPVGSRKGGLALTDGSAVHGERPRFVAAIVHGWTVARRSELEEYWRQMTAAE